MATETAVKSVVASKTIWVNLLTLLAGSLVYVADQSVITDNPLAVGGIAVATAVVNLVLRFFTTTAVK